MLGKTHIAVGIGTALLLSQPDSFEKCCVTILGGAFGGMICDIECHTRGNLLDKLHSRFTVAAIGIIMLIIDSIYGFGVVGSIFKIDNISAVLGLLIVLITCFVGSQCHHRTFTHSLIYVFLLCCGCGLIFPLIAVPVAYGCLSHIAIDILNKKPVMLFYPLKKGFCLKLCHSDKLVNRLMLFSASAFDIILISYKFCTFIMI